MNLDQLTQIVVAHSQTIAMYRREIEEIWETMVELEKEVEELRTKIHGENDDIERSISSLESSVSSLEMDNLLRD